MAGIDIQFQCGCGVVTKSASEAVKHAEEKKHTMTITGQIKK